MLYSHVFGRLFVGDEVVVLASPRRPLGVEPGVVDAVEVADWGQPRPQGHILANPLLKVVRVPVTQHLRLEIWFSSFVQVT